MLAQFILALPSILHWNLILINILRQPPTCLCRLCLGPQIHSHRLWHNPLDRLPRHADQVGCINGNGTTHTARVVCGIGIPRTFQVGHDISGKYTEAHSANVHDDAKTISDGIVLEPFLFRVSVGGEFLLPRFAIIVVNVVVIVSMQLCQYTLQIRHVLHQITIMKHHIIHTTSVSKQRLEIHLPWTLVHHRHPIQSKSVNYVRVRIFNFWKPRVRTTVDGVDLMLTSPLLRQFVFPPGYGNVVFVQSEVSRGCGGLRFSCWDVCWRAVGVTYPPL
mmetsp:Transcript_38169/g.70426  ORF Transcript_38169/g.70426 Transcript_38169/m.70426 type:complete len:276 (-) Transcript_38169:699-1526(-)